MVVSVNNPIIYVPGMWVSGTALSYNGETPIVKCITMSKLSSLTPYSRRVQSTLN